MRVPLVLLCLMMVPLAAAGSEADPEIEDPIDDSGDYESGRDVGAMWIEETESNGEPAFHFRLRVAEDHDHTPQFHALQVRYRIGFVPNVGLPEGDVEAYVYLRASQAGTSAPLITIPAGGGDVVNCKFGTTDEVGGSRDLDLEVDMAASMDEPTLFGCIVPHSTFPGFGPGDTLDNLVVETQLVTRGPTSGGLTAGLVPADKVPVTVLRQFDRSPDTGFGRIYMVPLPEPDLLVENITLPYSNTTAAPTTAAVQLLFNATGPLVLLADVEAGNITVNATIDGVRHLLWNGTEQAMLEADCDPCAWALTVHTEEFVGTWSIAPFVPEPETIEAPPADEPVEEPIDEPEVQAPSNETEEINGASDDQESPGLAWPVLVLALMALVRRKP